MRIRKERKTKKKEGTRIFSENDDRMALINIIGEKKVIEL
jgi:hypothetical protein